MYPKYHSNNSNTAMTPPPTNPAWTIPRTATTISHLNLQHHPIPIPGPHQVLIRLTAAALNYRDLLISTHDPTYPGPHKANLVPGSDAAGIIHSAHPTSRWAHKLGTTVILNPFAWESGHVRNLDVTKIYGAGTEDGVLQGWKVEDDVRVVEVTGYVSSVQWTCLPGAGATAWRAIREGMDARLNGELERWEGRFSAKRLEGKTILTQGTGGISCFAIQVSIALGYTLSLLTFADRSRPWRYCYRNLIFRR
jgi:NADPH:quinone reductase-like Zn-dependent oxidoreductase